MRPRSLSGIMLAQVSEVIRIVLVRLGEAFPHQVLWSAAAVTRSAVPKRRDAAAEVMKLVRLLGPAGGRGARADAQGMCRIGA